MTSEQESRLNVPFGYVAVLLVCLCLNQNIRRRVARELEGGQLRQLLDTVDKFLLYHGKVAEQLDESDQNADRSPDFVGRVQAVARQLEQAQL